MDEFVEQFLIEARELVEQGTAALDSLDVGGNLKTQIDSLFRAVHTLKGAAGIVDFDAMGRALHAVEGLLSELRSSSKYPSANFVRDCYACFDQVTRWLDEMQATGEMPKHADPEADDVVRRFAGAPTVQGQAPVQARTWLEQLSKEHPGSAAAGLSAFLYRPKHDAFFRADPLALAAAVPGILSLDLSLTDAVALEDLDPFDCTIRIAAFSSAPADAVRAIFSDVIDDVNVVEWKRLAADDRGLSSVAKALLEAQKRMLQLDESVGNAGRIGSAGKIAVNVLQLQQMAEKAAAVDAALIEGTNTGDPGGLVAAIENALRESPVTLADVDVDMPVARPASARSLRVDMDRIDMLVNLTGELMVVKNAIGHIVGMAQSAEDSKSIGVEMRKQHDLFERLVGQLQQAVLAIRVLPLRHVFQRFPRLVREISATLGRPVRLMIEGESTEADAAVVEGLFEPLLHVIRNAIGHGVEDPIGRKAVGKSAVATITLRAYRQLENVVVEVEDDGKGIDLVRVRDTAVARQVVTADGIAGMSDGEVVALIFAPGFSTATEVTGLSGRGVGMDAVKTAVERIGGSVSLETRAGQGTIVQLNLPFSVMMTRIMTVEASGQVFGLPLDAVVETALVPREAIVAVGAGRAVVLRDRALPVLDLTLELGLAKAGSAMAEVLIVVIAAGSQLGAIEVDRVGGRMDVMLKPMEGLLHGMGGVAGTTLMGDGRVLVVLDVQELFA